VLEKYGRILILPEFVGLTNAIPLYNGEFNALYLTYTVEATIYRFVGTGSPNIQSPSPKTVLLPAVNAIVKNTVFPITL
jgi:hypothetical protein